LAVRVESVACALTTSALLPVSQRNHSYEASIRTSRLETLGHSQAVAYRKCHADFWTISNRSSQQHVERHQDGTHYKCQLVQK